MNEWDNSPVNFPSFSQTPTPLTFKNASPSWKKLFAWGGFPEPLLEDSAQHLKRWQTERLERLFREDIRAAEQIRDFSKMELLAELLPSRVASPLSIQSLTEDCEVSHKTLASWLDLLARNYYIYRVPPYSKRIERALKKESKYYLWDWSEVNNEGKRFENMMASHLLKFCHFYYDIYGIKVDLWYLRDREKREVDFLVTWEKQPWFMVEAKLKAQEEDVKSIRYFSKNLGVKETYLVTGEEGVDYRHKESKVHILSAGKFLTGLI